MGKIIVIYDETNPNLVLMLSKHFYGSLSAGIHEEADSSGSKCKLKIENKFMNILVTMFARLKAEKPFDVGFEAAATTRQESIIATRKSNNLHNANVVDFIATADFWFWKSKYFLAFTHSVQRI